MPVLVRPHADALHAKARSLLEYIPSMYWDSIAAHTITANLSSYIQGAIDDLPDTGGALYAPAGRYPCTNLRIDGTGGGKINIKITGDGFATNFRKPDDSDLTTADDKRSCVIRAEGGSGFILRDLKVEGNKSRGGAKPAYGATWAVNTTYSQTFAQNPVTYSTKSDGTPVTPGTPSSVAWVNGGRTFIIATAHTSGAANILADLAAGKVTEVTGQAWDDLTQTGYTGYWENDADFAYRHCIYLHGEAAFIEDCLVDNVRVTDPVYGGIVKGSGPLFADGVGIGARAITTINCAGIGCASGGGGWNTFGLDIGPRSFSPVSSGFRYDQGSDDSTVIAPAAIDDASAVNGGLLVYKASRVKVIAPRSVSAPNGTWIEQSVDYDLLLPDARSQLVTINSSAPRERKFYDAQPVNDYASGHTLTPGESGRAYTNLSATSIAVFTLPAAVNGLTYTFIVRDADGIRIQAVGDDTIRIGANVSAAAGKAESTTIGDIVTIRGLSFTAWYATSVNGTWTVT